MPVVDKKIPSFTAYLAISVCSLLSLWYCWYLCRCPEDNQPYADLIVPVHVPRAEITAVNPNFETASNTEPVSGLANPASENCTEKGGKPVIKESGDGGQYGLCFFDDARACEEWALMRGDCPEGGVKTTGYDTEAQRYCAWLGGKTLAVPDALCTLPDGRECLAADLFQGMPCGG